ncbi:MAG TPA: GNAT family N-acetyltransferase [Chitinophagaceae bacterium]|nr:GNAT family N-acetyltransferase [Chitinophagaceae bacterium]
MPISHRLFRSFDELTRWGAIQDLGHKPICRGIDVVEKAETPDIDHYYLVSEQHGKAQMLAYFQLLHAGPQHFNLQGKRWQQWALNMALRCVKPTLLVAGNLFRHDVVFIEFLNDHRSAEEHYALYQSAIEFLVKQTNASGIFIKDIPAELGVQFRKNALYLSMPDDISMELHLPEEWKTFSDYEATLKHKYLQRCRKMRHGFEQVNVRELNETDVLKYSREMEALYLQVTRRQMVSMGILNHHFFEELKKSLGDDYRVCGYFLNGKLIAFSSAIVHNNCYDMNYIGFDYSLNHTFHLYFNILFQCLENTMALGCCTLILGRTALEAKAIMGCEPDYRYSFYRLRNPVVQRFYLMVSSYFHEQQGEHWKERHPFKSGYYLEKKK